jgi:urease accessory protein
MGFGVGEGPVLADTALPSEIFAGNRAISRIAVSVAADGADSRRQRVHEAGALRVRFPNVARGDALTAVFVNTAGGMTGGDHFNIDIALGAGARLAATTAAAEKIYRSLGPDTRIDVKFDVGAGAALAWVPQETILFDRVRLRRSIEADLARDASLLLAESVVFGRSAMGETVLSGHFFDRWRIRIGGALAFAESLRLDGNIAQHLARRAVANDGVAIASVLKIPGDDAAVAAVRAIEKDFVGEVGVSTWNGLTIVRLVARDGAALRHDLVGAVTALGGMPLPRLWLN